MVSQPQVPSWWQVHPQCNTLAQENVPYGHPPVQHAAQDLGGHDNAAGVLVDGDIPSHQPHILKLLAQLSELLIGERLHAMGSVQYRQSP